MLKRKLVKPVEPETSSHVFTDVNKLREAFISAKEKIGKTFCAAHRDGIIQGKLVNVCLFRKGGCWEQPNDPVLGWLQGMRSNYEYEMRFTLSGPQRHEFVVFAIHNDFEDALDDFMEENFPMYEPNRYLHVAAVKGRYGYGA